MIQNKLKTLVDLLYDKTVKREVIWQKTSNDAEFKLALKSGALTIDKWEHDYNNYIEVVLYNDNGDKIDVFQGTDNNNEEIEIFKFLDNFHQEVRRAHYKVDETIDGFLDEIRSEGVIGKQQEIIPLPPEEDDLPF